MKIDIDMTRKMFSEIMKEFGPAVYHLALSFTGDIELANDIYQQTFLLLLEKKPTFTCRVQLKVWLLRCARKISASELRRAENRRTVPLDGIIEQPAVIDACSSEFYDFLCVLSPKYRQVTVLFYIEDMSVKDIASVLSISVSAVKTRLARARSELKKIYKEELL